MNTPEPSRRSDDVRLPALLKMMADQMPAIVWAVDAQLRFTVSFGAGLAALGLHPAEVVGKDLFEYFQTDDPTFGSIAAHLAALRGVPQNYEQQWQNRVFQVHCEPLVDAQLGVIGALGIAIDITDRKRAEDALRQNEELYRNVFEDGPLGVALLGLDGRVMRTNRRLQELLGYDEHELIAIGVSGISHPEDLETDERLLTRLLAGQIPSYTIEKRYVCRSGAVIWGRLTVSVTRDESERPTHIIGIVEDVTKRRTAEDRLREARDTLEQKVEERTRELYEVNRKLVSTLESITDGFVAVDRDRRFVYLNPSAAELLEVNREELRGRYAFDVMPELRSLECIETMRRSMELGVAGHFEQYYAPNNAWYEGHCYPSPEGLSIYFRDITERKNAQEAVRREQQALRRMVLASDHERRLITYELHDGVAQNLIASVMYFQAAEQQASDDGPPWIGDLREGMRELHQASNELRRLMNGLRTPVLDNFGLAEAIGDVVEQLRSRPGAPRIDYHPDVNFGRLESTLENSLFRIAQEAIMNACRHSQSDRVLVTLCDHPTGGLLEVRDWGVGFLREGRHDNRFGLESILERARLIGAKLDIASRPGAGAVIRLEFPVVERMSENS
ncbi:MAG: PAS domain S-box protein [Pirellulales bacterium]